MTVFSPTVTCARPPCLTGGGRLSALGLALFLSGPLSAQAQSSALQPRGEVLQPRPGASSPDPDRQGAPGEPHTTEVTMFVGESRVFSVPGARRIAVGNGKVMSASAMDGREILAFANAVGSSSMLVWADDGSIRRFKVNVTTNDTQRLGRDIARFLAGMPGVKTHIVGESVIVEGEQLADADLAKIDELGKRYPQIVNFTNRVGWESMVLIDVKVVEFPRNELRELGLKWSAAGGVAVGGIWSIGRRGDQGGVAINIPKGTGDAPITNSISNTLPVPLPSSLNVISGMNMGINATLNMMAQDGRASILAEPQLSARNGSKATFLAGGEFPFTVSTLAGQTVVFKPYGIRLDIVPRVDRNGVVRASIESEVSSIDTSTTTSAGPALITRKTNTEFNMRNGETLVLAGLLSRRTSNTIDKVPGIGDVPVLGALFRSRRFQNDETELVVFVTPTVVSPSTPELLERIQRTTAELQAVTPERTFLPPIATGAPPARAMVSATPAPLASPVAVAPRPVPVPPVAAAPLARPTPPTVAPPATTAPRHRGSASASRTPGRTALGAVAACAAEQRPCCAPGRAARRPPARAPPGDQARGGGAGLARALGKDPGGCRAERPGEGAARPGPG